MLRVGLTGGIACGKSLVAELFRQRSVPVVNDDDVARDAVAPGSEGLAAVVAEFGAEMLLRDGSLDRAALGRRVFADDRQRRRLMAITHPFIAKLITERLAAAERLAPPMVVYESALLIENGIGDGWRPMIVVRTTRDRQIERLAQRNGLTAREAEDRIRSQMSVDEKASLADYVIENVGTPADVEERFAVIWAELASRGGDGVPA